jgi:hypothetical protein
MRACEPLLKEVDGFWCWMVLVIALIQKIRDAGTVTNAPWVLSSLQRLKRAVEACLRSPSFSLGILTMPCFLF